MLLALVVGAFTSSLVYRWTATPPPEGSAGAGAACTGVVSAGPATDPSGIDRGRIRVEVLNAARVPGLADRMTGFLRRLGFDVVNYGNAAGEPRDRTLLLDRVGDARLAREVALELPGTPIRQDLSPDGFVDVTVLVGRDYERFFTPRAEQDGTRADGRVRRLWERLRSALGI